MGLDRGALARIDRKLLSGLGRDQIFRMIRVPVSDAKWSTWKRYCDSAGISMGRAIRALIERELIDVFDEAVGSDAPVLASEAEERLVAREAQIATEEQDIDAAEDRLREWAERLRLSENELRKRGRRVASVTTSAIRAREASPKVGRNERCPCGSGLKHKYCHGS